MIRNSGVLFKLYRRQHFRLSKCQETTSVTFERNNSTFEQSNKNSEKKENNVAFAALSLSLIGAVSYYFYNKELKNYLKDSYQVHALNKEKNQ